MSVKEHKVPLKTVALVAVEKKMWMKNNNKK